MQVSEYIMKKFLLKIAVLFTLLFIIDRISGVVLRNWLSNIPKSYVGKDNYICNTCNEVLLVFGSSRAEYHYNVKMIEDTLGVSSYNCGTSGFGIILSYGRLTMLSNRYHPKFIIMDVTPEFDYVENGNNRKDFQHLKRHYDCDGIKEIFETIDPIEKFKMMSYLYRYNSDWLHNPMYIIKRNSADRNAMGIQGFIAEKQKLDKMKISKRNENEVFDIDAIKYMYFKRFVKSCMEYSKVVMVVSPYYNGRNSAIFEPARVIADSLRIPFLDYSNSAKYVHRDEYFKDGVHLNASGADEFTHDIINDIKIIM